MKRIDNKLRRVLPLLALLVLLPALVACGDAASGAMEEPDERAIRVVATTGMVADIVRNVGGERVEVHQLMGPGIDPHLYRASEGDVRRLAEAEIIFYNGLHLEARMADVFARMAEGGRTTVAIAEAVPEAERLSPPEFDGYYDPHVWMDAKLWLHTIEPVREALARHDGAHAELYRANAESYRERLEELEVYVQARVNELPPERRVLVTAHDAFNYFGRGYSFEVFAPQGISTETEAGIEDIRAVIGVLVERDIPAVFVETTVSPDIIQAVQEGARARGHEVTIGGELFTDAMGEEGTPEGTYEGMIRHNIDTIVQALQ
jgi:manganese/zinc/iron transport system substrate-binding protein